MKHVSQHALAQDLAAERAKGHTPKAPVPVALNRCENAAVEVGVMAHRRVPALAAATIVVSEVERRPSAPAFVPIADRHVYIMYIHI